MKKILITGISRGLGKILAEFFEQQGCMVYGTVRNLKKFHNTERVRYFYLDLQKKQSINKAMDLIYEDAGTIDAVIHNAGIAYLDPADVMSDRERRHVFDVNFFGPLCLTEAILPHLRTAKQGKLIFISSVVSVDHWPSLGVYSASKAALECVAFEWAVLLKQWNIDVSIIRANPLPTDMQIMRSMNANASPYDKSFCNELLWEKTQDVCDLVLEIINCSSPKFEYVTGEFSKKSIDAVLKKDAYQKLIDKYRKKLNIL
jgi:hypothetical protein